MIGIEMETTLIVIDSDDELARARALVDRLMASNTPADRARLAAQARLIAAYEQQKWPPRSPGVGEVIGYLMDRTGCSGPIWCRFWGAPSGSMISRHG